jgi:hypothetical protein
VQQAFAGVRGDVTLLRWQMGGRQGAGGQPIETTLEGTTFHTARFWLFLACFAEGPFAKKDSQLSNVSHV